ncbi:MAG: hypothetical protein HQK49_20210 [Oligoflexia bacterium]|nr:hypothetical protein [Oligoflexia bacterium]
MKNFKRCICLSLSCFVFFSSQSIFFKAYAESGSENVNAIANDFRLIVGNLLHRSGSNLNINKIMYLPPSELLQPQLNGINSTDILEAIAENFSEKRPTDLLSNTVSANNFLNKSIDEKINSSLFKLKKNPVTIILMDGMFTEFTKNHMFNEIFTNQYKNRSSFHKQWIKKINNKRANLKGRDDDLKHRHQQKQLKDLLWDKHKSILETEISEDGEYDPEEGYSAYVESTEIGYTNSPIEELVEISGLTVGDFITKKDTSNASITSNGIDDSDQEVARVIFMKSPMYSLESIEDYSLTSEAYIRRLSKVFSILDETPNNIYLLGYSRGSLVGLEMLRTAKKLSNKYQWTQNIKGYVSLSGVIYGTDYADEVLCEKNQSAEGCKQLTAIMDFAENLTYLGQYPNEGIVYGSVKFFQRLPTIAYNLRAVVLLLKDLLKATDFDNLKSFSLLNKKMENFENKYKYNYKYNHKGSDQKWFFPNPKRAIEDAMEIIELIREGFATLRATDFNWNAFFILNVGLEGLHLQNVYSEHDLIIKKLRIVCENIYRLVTQISTKKRLEWWSSSELPTKDIHYYSITATMFERDSSTANESNYYQSEGLDFLIQNYSYNLLARHYNFYLNDSKVVMHKSVFWKDLNSSLNPYYITNPLNATWLTVAGVDHWGIACGATVNRIEHKNKFPRLEMIKALAITFVQ